jgi:hypothetical protein
LLYRTAGGGRNGEDELIKPFSSTVCNDGRVARMAHKMSEFYRNRGANIKLLSVTMHDDNASYGRRYYFPKHA